MIKIGYDILKQFLCSAGLALFDALGIGVCFWLGYYIRGWFFVDVIPIPIFAPIQHSLYVYTAMWPLLSLWLILFVYEDLYPSIGMSFWEETKAVLKGDAVAFMAIILMTFITKTSGEFSRFVIGFAFLSSLIILPLIRMFARSMLIRMGLWSKDVVLIGAENAVKEVLCNLKKHPDWGYRPVGVVLQAGEAPPEGLQAIGTVDSLGSIALHADEVIVAMPDLSRGELVEVVETVSRRVPVVKVVADLYGLASAGVRAYDFNGMLLLEMADRLALKKNRAMKRTFDIIFSLSFLIAMSPAFLLIALIVKIDSRGPVLFGHTRLGRGGKSFTCYKFRTMALNAQEVLEDLLMKDPQAREQWEKDFKLKDDPRVTRAGRILRKTSLDELPQFWNVLKGEMSLVGPRPIVADEVGMYGAKAKYFFKVVPGITGLWQVSGRNDINYDERVLLDEYYAKNWSLWLDIEILLRTLGAVMKKEGAY